MFGVSTNISDLRTRFSGNTMEPHFNESKIGLAEKNIIA